ncbi:hypothetical protein P3T35_004056 [Kitasatospora sp. GP30]|nr:hypothetical protein [Kitasatospora sp. GP30]
MSCLCLQAHTATTGRELPALPARRQRLQGARGRRHPHGRRPRTTELSAYQGSVPEASKYPPVGPSGPTSAIRTMISAPSSTVWWPEWSLRSVAV